MYNISKYFMIASAFFCLVCCCCAALAGYVLKNDATCYILALVFLGGFVWFVASIKRLNEDNKN